MRWEAWRLLGYSSLVGCLCLIYGIDQARAQRGAPRPTRRAGPPAADATATRPQPLAPEAKITLDQRGLTIDVQEQDLSSIVTRIATLGDIDIRHLEGLPQRRVSVRFTALPMVDGLKRLFRVADVPGYVLVTTPQRSHFQVQRIIFLAEEGGPTTLGARGTQRYPAVAATQSRPAFQPPGRTPAPPPEANDSRGADSTGETSVFDDLKSNAAARRLLSQMMHPNEQVRERAFEGLVRVFRDDEKQRSLLEFLEPLMEDLTSEDKATQDEARAEIRKLLSR